MSEIEIDSSTVGRWVKKAVMYGVGGILLLILANGTFFTVDAGWNVVYQNTLFGNLTTFNEQGVKLRVPFWNKVEHYKQVGTVNYLPKRQQEESEATRVRDMVGVRFADTYTGSVPAVVRFKLPADPDKMIVLHKDYRTFSNLVDALVISNTRKAIIVTATQYTGEEFFQGGLNGYTAALEDQLRYGLYVTKRQQVEVAVTEIAKTGLEQTDSTKLESTKKLVWKTVPQKDSDGNFLRQRNPFADYGVTITQVTLGDPVPSERLAELLKTKQELVGKRIATVQQLETAKAEARTAQAQEEIQRTVARQRQLKVKEVAVIQKSQEVEVARQQAKREIVDQEKRRDLALIERDQAKQVAEANLAIRNAELAAALLEAQSIEAIGFAEANVTKAKYAALEASKPIYLAEINRDVATVLYENMKDFDVKMPSFVMNGGGNSDGKVMNNMSVLTSLLANDMLKKNISAVESK